MAAYRSVLFFAFAVLAAGVLLFGGGCKKAAAPEEGIVARVGEERISSGELAAELKRRAARGAEAKPEAVLDGMIRGRALLAKARAEGFDKEPEVVARVERMIAAAYEEKLRGSPATNSAAEVREFYEKNPGLFATAEQVRLAGIFVRVPSKAVEEKRVEAAAKFAEAAKGAAALGVGEGFGDAARRVSEDQASRHQRGDLGWLNAAQIEERFGLKAAEGIAKLKGPGQMTDALEGPGGLWVFRLMEKKGAGTKPFAEAREVAAYRLQQQRQEDAAKALEGRIRAGLRIEVNEQELAKAAASVTNAPQTPRAVGP